MKIRSITAEIPLHLYGDEIKNCSSKLPSSEFLKQVASGTVQSNERPELAHNRSYNLFAMNNYSERSNLFQAMWSLTAFTANFSPQDIVTLALYYDHENIQGEEYVDRFRLFAYMNQLFESQGKDLHQIVNDDLSALEIGEKFKPSDSPVEIRLSDDDEIPDFEDLPGLPEDYPGKDLDRITYNCARHAMIYHMQNLD